MPIDYASDLPHDTRDDLEAFIGELARHPWGGSVDDCRLVVADPHPADPAKTVSRVLERWMKPDEYESWVARKAQALGYLNGRVVRPHESRDGVITAIVGGPFDRNDFLHVAGHELVEAAREAKHHREGWTRPSRAVSNEWLGIILFDEYAADRTSHQIAQDLSWPEGREETRQVLIHLTDEIFAGLPPAGSNVLPNPNYMEYWKGLARTWAMVAGRRAAGSEPDDQLLLGWAQHPLIADQGWSTVERTMAELFRQPTQSRDELVQSAATRIFDPIMEYAWEAWTTAKPAAPGP